MDTFQVWLRETEATLATVSSSPRTDLIWLVRSVLGAHWMWSSTVLPTQAELAKVQELATRALLGEPVAYILGEWDFYGLTFCVGPGVLIPRQDTELIVDEVLKDFRGYQHPIFADFGSGSGCLAVVIARNLPSSQGLAIEASDQAVYFLKQNIDRHSIQSMSVLNKRVQEFSLDESKSDFDFIVANPPYIAEGDGALSDQVKQFEPRQALIAEDQGLREIDQWLDVAYKKLKMQGRYYFEIGWKQSKLVEEIVKRHKGFRLVRVVADYGGHPRVVVCEKVSGRFSA